MELLLKRNVTDLGRIGEVVEVKAGYARNYLLPLGMAVPVTKANLEQIEKARAAAFAEEAKTEEVEKPAKDSKSEDAAATAAAPAGEDVPSGEDVKEDK